MTRVARWILPLGVSSLPPLELPLQGPVLIGRKPECQLRLPNTDKRISGQHCRLAFSGTTGPLQLEDLSSHGTFVNGEAVGRVGLKAIHVGDVLSLTNPAKEGEHVRFVVASELPKQVGPTGPPSTPTVASNLPQQVGPMGPSEASAGLPDDSIEGESRGSADIPDQTRASVEMQPPKKGSSALRGISRGAALPAPSMSNPVAEATLKASCTDPSWHAAGKNHPLVPKSVSAEPSLATNAAKFASSKAARRLGITAVLVDPGATMQKMYDKLITQKLEKLGGVPAPPQRKTSGSSSSKAIDSKGKQAKSSKKKKAKKHKKAKEKKTKNNKIKFLKAKKRNMSSSSSSSSSGVSSSS